MYRIARHLAAPERGPLDLMSWFKAIHFEESASETLTATLLSKPGLPRIDWNDVLNLINDEWRDTKQDVKSSKRDHVIRMPVPERPFHVISGPPFVR